MINVIYLAVILLHTTRVNRIVSMSRPATLPSLEEMDSLLGARASDQSAAAKMESHGSEQRKIWNWISKNGEQSSNGANDEALPSQSDDASRAPMATFECSSSSPQSQPDLIELSSSVDGFSICSTSSDYKSCDEDDAQQRDCGGFAQRSTPKIVLDATESDKLPSVLRVPSDSECRLNFNVLQSNCDQAYRKFLSPLPLPASNDVDDDDNCCSPEDEPFVIGRFPQCPSAAQLSVTSSNSDPTIPTCRICHLPAGEEDSLISPCRCSGTMQYIHNGCLMKWLEVSSRKSKRPPSCELCLYQYHRHKKFKVNHWQFPQCSLRDKILHTIFFLSLLTMIGAATVTILCFKHDKGGGRMSLDKNRLTQSEIVTLVCGVLFFVAFFLAMYVEVKARSTIYKIIMDFLYLNQQWYIDEYDKKMDIQSMPV